MLGVKFRDKMLLYADVWSLQSFEDRCVEGKWLTISCTWLNHPYNSSFRSVIMVYWMGFNKCRLWYHSSGGGWLSCRQVGGWKNRNRAYGFLESEQEAVIANSYRQWFESTSYIMICYTVTMGHAMTQWLRHCATNRKVAGSIPDGVIGIFHWHNPSGRTMALGST
jgi:hypothetical protein